MRYQKLLWGEKLIQFLTVVTQGLAFDLSVDWVEANSTYMVEKPDVVVWHALLDESDNILIALPMVHTQKRFFISSKMFVLTSFYSSLSVVYVSYLAREQDVLKTLLLAIMKNNCWSSIELSPFDPSDALMQCVAALNVPFVSYFRFKNWFCQVPRGYAEFEKALPSTLLNTLKRKSKKIEAVEDLHLKIVSSEFEVDKAIEAYNLVYKLSWKSQEYKPDFVEFVCKRAAEKGCLRLGLVYIGDQPIAAQIWFVQGQIASIFKLAYDPNFKNLSVGTYLSSKMFEFVIETDRVKEIDYGMGDENYKSDWMNRCRDRFGILIFNRNTIRGLWLILRHKLITKWVERIRHVKKRL